MSWMGLQLWWNSIAELLEEKLEPQLMASIGKVLESVRTRQGKFTLREATARKYGGFVYVDVKVGMDPSITLLESHAASERIESLIKRALPFVSGVDVDAEPSSDEPADYYGGAEEQPSEPKSDDQG